MQDLQASSIPECAARILRLEASVLALALRVARLDVEHDPALLVEDDDSPGPEPLP